MNATPRFEEKLTELAYEAFNLTVQRELEIRDLNNPWSNMWKRQIVWNGLGQIGRFDEDGAKKTAENFCKKFVKPKEDGDGLAKNAYQAIYDWSDLAKENRPYAFDVEWALGKPRVVASRLLLQHLDYKRNFWFVPLSTIEQPEKGQNFAHFGLAQQAYDSVQEMRYASFPCVQPKDVTKLEPAILDEVAAPSVRLIVMDDPDEMYLQVFLEATWIPYGGWFPVIYGGEFLPERPEGQMCYACQHSRWMGDPANVGGMPIYKDFVNELRYDMGKNYLVPKRGGREDWGRLRDLMIRKRGDYYTEPPEGV